MKTILISFLVAGALVLSSVVGSLPGTSGGGTVQARAAVFDTTDLTKREARNLGPSSWKGGKLRHPRGGRFPYNVERWANIVRSVMKEHGIRRKFLPGILAQIHQESSGNPRAVNRWDINWRNGVPSKGLLQVIKPTYKAYAKPGFRHKKWMKVPYTNIWAALNYTIDRYGKRKFKLWNRGFNHGY